MNGKRSQNKLIGSWGECRACRYLEDEGYTLIVRNFRSRYGEIDIIACRAPWMVFAEVKTRKSGAFGYPAEAVTPEKQRRFRLTAEFFLLKNRMYGSLQPRMDVIEIMIADGSAWLRHDENAF